MSDFNESRSNVDFAAKNAINNNKSGSAKQFVLWIGALFVGAALGWAGNGTLNEFFDFVDDENLMTNHERGKKDQLILLLKIKIFYGLYQ